jgi:hypothetical protein
VVLYHSILQLLRAKTRRKKNFKNRKKGTAEHSTSSESLLGLASDVQNLVRSNPIENTMTDLTQEREYNRKMSRMLHMHAQGNRHGICDGSKQSHENIILFKLGRTQDHKDEVMAKK